VAITGKLYGQFLRHALLKEVQLLTDNLAVTLHQVGYVPDQDNHEYVSSLTSECPATGGYTTGGQNLASKTLTYTAATNKITLNGATVSWASSTITARVVVVSDRTPATAAVQPLILYQLSDVDIVSSGGPFDVQWNAAGLVEVTIS